MLYGSWMMPIKKKEMHSFYLLASQVQLLVRCIIPFFQHSKIHRLTPMLKFVSYV